MVWADREIARPNVFYGYQHKYLVWPNVIMISLVAVPVPDTQTYISTYCHRDTECITDVSVTNVSLSYSLCTSFVQNITQDHTIRIQLWNSLNTSGQHIHTVHINTQRSQGWDTLWCLPLPTVQFCRYHNPIPSLVTASYLEGWFFLWSISWPGVSHEFTLSTEEHEWPHPNTQGGYLHASSGRVLWFFWFGWKLIRWDKRTETPSKQNQLQPAVIYSLNKYFSK